MKKKENFNHVTMTTIFTFDPTLPAEPEMPHRVFFLIKKLTTSELELTNGYVSPFINSQGDGLCADSVTGLEMSALITQSEKGMGKGASANKRLGLMTCFALLMTRSMSLFDKDVLGSDDPNLWS